MSIKLGARDRALPSPSGSSNTPSTSSDMIRSLLFTSKERKVRSTYTAPPPNRQHSPGVVSQLINKIELKTSPTNTSSRPKKKKKAPPLAKIDDLDLVDDEKTIVSEVVKSPRRKKYTGNPLGNLKILNNILPSSKASDDKENSGSQQQPSTGKKLKKSRSKSRVEPESEAPFRLKRTLTDLTNNHTPAGSTWRQMVSNALGGPLKKRLSEGALLFPGTSKASDDCNDEEGDNTKTTTKRRFLQRRKQSEKSAGGANGKESGGGSASSSFFGALIRLSHSAASLTSLTSLGGSKSRSASPSPSSSRSNTKEFKENLSPPQPPPPDLIAPAAALARPTFSLAAPDSPVSLAPPSRELRKSKTCQITTDRPPIIPSITISESRSLNRIDRCRPVTVDGSGLSSDCRPLVSRRSTMSRTMSLIPTSPSLPPLYEEETASTAAMVEEERADRAQKRRMRRYGGSNTTSTYQGRKDVAPDASPRRHLIGFLHRTSHLSLTSELSADASFYLIGHRRHLEESTIGSESDARVFSDDDDRGSTTTDFTSVSRQHEKMAKKKKNKRNFRKPSRASSFSSITESSMSLDVITVNLNMDTVNFLGISIVGQTSNCGDNGIYVANIMKGGAVALDGRIEAGDMILQVNETSFENFTNDQAVDVLREAVSRRGPIKLTVAKSFENGQSCFTIPRNSREEPVRPIDTQAWIQHTNAMRGMPSIVEESAPTPIPGEWPHGRPPSSSTVTSNGSNGQNTVVGGGAHIILDIHTDKKKVVEIMAMPGSGLDIKNRTWLKIPIPMSFLGSDLVEWLLDHVEGLRERKTARNFAADLLKLKYIAHVVNKVTFTEQCYYVLGDECSDYARFRNEDGGPKYQWTIGMNGMSAGNGSSVMLPPPHLPGGMAGPPGAFKGMAPSMVSDGESRMYVMHI
ncbi:DiSHevelled related [Caenorhabditis elegans]|uniref:DiSHevelled related n=1 Tax=Caenorhabditis elegans TaxID=6239 RepID=B1Q240_CAEEL|nr:DiSHevelled related [Caenorhabditis elegans]CCD65828.2 DiSHevelled related [Caenorhabditis elegans]|eukprot:NP_494980.4 DiSHevelled related [Caenorhabditis elegans]